MTDADAQRTGLISDDQQKKDSQNLKIRIAGMVIGIFFAHAFVALALHYTYMDDQNNFHTSVIALYGALVCGVIFCWHQGMA